MNAPDNAVAIKAAISAFIAFGTAIFGWVGWIIVIWVATMLLDYITGTCAAIANNEWKSSIAREGLWHKLGSIFALLVAALCDLALNVLIANTNILAGIDFNFDGLLTPIVAAWYIFTELGSIIENAAKLGAPIPEWLKDIVQKLKRKIDSDREKGKDDTETK